MAEADTTLLQKKSELETALSEVRRELSRVDEAQRSDAHRELVAVCGEASDWLEKHGRQAENVSAEETASLAQKAEGLLHDIRMRRNAI